MNDEKHHDSAAPMSAASGLRAGLERIDKQAWTRSTTEEVIAALWMIASIISFGFQFDAMGWFCAIKSASDMCASIWLGWNEAIANKRSNAELCGSPKRSVGESERTPGYAAGGNGELE